MAGKILADIIEAPAGRISLNVGNTVVASINASGLYTSTGNLLITQANSIGTAAIENGAVTNAKLTLTANASAIKTALNASGDPGIFAARAWVNFNGTSTVAIRGSGNVTSITDNGAGDYTVNLTTAMPDANYSAVSSGGTGSNNIRMCSCAPVSLTSNSQIRVIGITVNADALIDLEAVSVAIFR
jgi:hypothetical protein